MSFPPPLTARGKDNLKKFLQVGALSTNSISIVFFDGKDGFPDVLGNTCSRAGDRSEYQIEQRELYRKPDPSLQ